jgi:hypothetical protein
MSQLVKLILKVLSDLEPLRGSSTKKTLYSTRSCANWARLETRGPLKRSFHSRFKLAHSCQKTPIYTRTRQINYYFILSVSPVFLCFNCFFSPLGWLCKKINLIEKKKILKTKKKKKQK